MKLAYLLLACVPAWALSNAVILQEKSGSTQTNRVVTIPRYFAAGEVCNYSAPYAGGVVMSKWQVDVKTRWLPDANCAAGYTRIALITVEVPSLSGSGTLSVEFRSSSSASSGGTGLTKAQMLAFDTGSGAASWGAAMSLTTGGITKTSSARTMLTSDFYQVLESGPLRTTVLIREGPDSVAAVTTRTTSIGFQCTANCTAPYDTATWADNSAYYSMRPSYVVSFYSSPSGGTNRVEVDYILDNAWFSRAQDQRIETFILYNGGSETNVVYTAPTAVVVPFRARVLETFWSATPPALNIDFNRPYVIYSKATPAYDQKYIVGTSARAVELADFNAGDKGATVTAPTTFTADTTSGSAQLTNASSISGIASYMYITGTGLPAITTVTSASGANVFLSKNATATAAGVTFTVGTAPQLGWAQISDQGAAAGGAQPILGWAPRWEARYLATFDPDMLTVVLGDAKAYMHAPIWYLEDNTSSVYFTGNPAKAFGRPVSLDARPGFKSSIGSSSDGPIAPSGTALPNGPSGTPCSAPTCMVTCADRSSAILNWCSAYTSYQDGITTHWGQDGAHSIEIFLVPYLFTGKFIYLEAEWTKATWDLNTGIPNTPGSPPPAYGKWDNKGLIYEQGNTIRWTVWSLRNVSGATLISPDGSLEATYFQQKLNNNLESNEGRFNITNGSFPPNNSSCSGFNKNTETSIWRMSRCWYENGWTNPTNISMTHNGGNACLGCDASKESDGVSTWMESYGNVSFNWQADVGFKSSYINNLFGGRTMHVVQDTNYSRGPSELMEYRTPANTGTSQTLPLGYIQTWAAVRDAIVNGTHLSLDIGSGDTTIPVIDFETIDGSFIDLNQYEASFRDTYYKIDSEVVLVAPNGIAAVSRPITAVNTGTSRATSVGHGLTNGQIIRIASVNDAQQAIDNGMVGNSLCKLFSGGRNYYCDFWTKVIDADTVEFYNDAGLTSLVTLLGGGVNMTMFTANYTVTRGALGTTPAVHTENTHVDLWPVVATSQRVKDATGAHGLIYVSAAASAVDRDLTVVDEGTGKTISARHAYEFIDNGVWFQEHLGANTANCTTSFGSTAVDQCDNPQWGIRPRPLVRNIRVIQLAGAANLLYTAPDGNTCKYAVSTTPFSSSSDAGDTTDGLSNLARSVTLSSLSASATYNYRISCGIGGAARAMGQFSTSSSSAPSLVIRGKIKVSGKIRH